MLRLFACPKKRFTRRRVKSRAKRILKIQTETNRGEMYQFETNQKSECKVKSMRL